MKFSVGYQLPDADEPPFAEIVREFAPHVDEVYFAWPRQPSGRSPTRGAEEQLLPDLRATRALGVRLNLLLNASCYGRDAYSQTLAELVTSLVARLMREAGLDAVTTMSPMIADAVKRHFPRIDVRASVNMRLGTVKSFEYVAELFDSFCMQREFNRDFARVRELSAWCAREGKRLTMLVNSGCLNFCSVQTFHDNLVAHEGELDPSDCASADSPAMCRRWFAKRERWVTFLQNSWVRPEDVGRYDGLVSTMKLATRMHANPRRVLRAYSEGKFSGNLPDLFEPGHGPAFAPFAIDNSRFPADWFDRTAACDKRCDACDYCAKVLEQVLVRVG